MVKIHKCPKCKEEIYYLPIFGKGRDEEPTRFAKMNLDKSTHECFEAQRLAAEAEQRFEEAAARDTKQFLDYLENRDW